MTTPKDIAYPWKVYSLQEFSWVCVVLSYVFVNYDNLLQIVVSAKARNILQFYLLYIAQVIVYTHGYESVYINYMYVYNHRYS